MELLDERWTLLVVRELLLGSRHFNDVRRGVPKMSPALLSKRLKALTRAGVVERSEIDGRTNYSLTQCGQELGEVENLGRILDLFTPLVGGYAADGWSKMFDFFETPSPMIGSIGPVAQGANFDWARQDTKPGLLNLNLIIDAIKKTGAK